MVVTPEAGDRVTIRDGAKIRESRLG